MTASSPVEQSLTQLPRLEQVPELIFVTPTQTANRILRSALKTQSGEEIRSRGLLADSVSWCSSADAAVLGPLLGAPAAVTAVEPLLAAGGKRMVLFGVAGGIPSATHKVAIGDVLCPGRVVYGEKSSKVYQAFGESVNAPSAFQSYVCTYFADLLASDELLGVWTTDTPYCETKDDIASYSSRGAALVEMEYAALRGLASQYDIEFAAVFVVSDLLGQTWQKGFASKEVKQALGVAAEALVRGLLPYSMEEVAE